jgi:saccharopine dehydrogenase-like NADP-dependent oxidoreductase
MGFASHELIDVKGVQVAPVDVLMKLVKRPGNKFFTEDPKSILTSDLTGIMDVSVEGEKDGQRVRHSISYRFTDGPNHARQHQLFNTFGTTMVYVALPAVVGARMCVQGDVESGVITADSLDPAKFFAGMEARGVPFEFDEKIKLVNPTDN